MKKTCLKFYRRFVIFGLAAMLLSCGDNRQEEIFDDEKEDIENNTPTETDEIAKIIAQNVYAYVSSYSNYSYSWNISITTYLEEVYPHKTIKYGILCGYNNLSGYWWKYSTLTGNSIIDIAPLFIDGAGTPYSTESFIWQSLIALLEQNSLTESDQMLKKDIIYYLDKVEKEALNEYWGQVFVEIDDKKYIIKEYGNKRIENSNSSGNSSTENNSNNNSESYEKPDVGFYDYSATKNSLNIQYKIYNRDEAKVSSAKIYYGTSPNPSSSVNATISGVLIKANISGLKAGTTYYVKCVVTGKGGTTTTSVTKCLTNYGNGWY